MKAHTAAAWVAALFLASSVFGHTVALRLALLAAGIILSSIVVAKNRRIEPRPPLWIPFVLWGAWAALSFFWSLEPERTLKEWKNEIFYTGAALWVCYVGAQARDAARIFLPVLGIAGAAACAIALRDFAEDWERYMQGWHGGPGDHSSALLVLMPCAALTAWWAVRRARAFWIAAASIALAAILFASASTTLNRTLWLGFAIQFLVLGTLLLARRHARSGKRPGLKGRAVAYAVGVAIVAACGAALLAVQAYREAAGLSRSIEDDPRIALWPQVRERIAERPLLGYGFGRGMLREALQAELKGLDPNLWHAHNLFLDVALQVGIPGLALFLVLLAALAREAWRAARSADEVAAACGMALAGVVAGMAVRNMTDSLLILFWGVVGALLAISARPWQARS
jgi:putative inorganic carbon (hco3(-)) transporter